MLQWQNVKHVLEWKTFLPKLSGVFLFSCIPSLFPLFYKISGLWNCPMWFNELNNCFSHYQNNFRKWLNFSSLPNHCLKVTVNNWTSQSVFSTQRKKEKEHRLKYLKNQYQLYAAITTAARPNLDKQRRIWPKFTLTQVHP